MILVTGGTGFLGSCLLRKLIREGLGPIRAIRRKKSRIPADLRDQVEWVKADVLDIPSLEQAFEGVQEVYHCAAMISFNPREMERMYSINVEGSSNMVNMALSSDVKRFLHVSSIAALGRHSKSGKPVTETVPFDPEKSTSHYALCKYESEMQVRRGMAEGLAAVIVNPAVIIGPADRWDNGSVRLITQAWEGLPFHPRGGTGFVDVRDCANIMVKLMEGNHLGEGFIMNGVNTSYATFYKLVMKYLDKRPTYGGIPSIVGEVAWRMERLRSKFTGKSPILTKETFHQSSQTYRYNADKVKALLGYEFLSLEKSLKDSCEAFLRSQKKSSKK